MAALATTTMCRNIIIFNSTNQCNPCSSSEGVAQSAVSSLGIDLLCSERVSKVHIQIVITTEIFAKHSHG